MRGLAVNAGARIPHAGAAPAVKPQFVGASAAGGGGTIFVVSHLAGDRLITITKKGGGGGGIPSARVGAWTTPTGGTWVSAAPVTMGFRIEQLVDAAGSIATIAVDVNTVCACLVYRGGGAINLVDSDVAAAINTIAAPTVNASEPGGALMLELFTCPAGSITSITGSGITERYNQDVSLGGGDVIVVESDTLVAVSPAASSNCTDVTYPTAATLEMLAG